MFRKLLAIAAVCLATADVTARAQLIDVTGTTSSTVLTSASGGSFIVSGTELQPTGTGVFDPFLTIQRNGQESGFNTDIPNTLDTKRLANRGPGGWTTTIKVGQVGFATIDGIDYLEFVLDVNQAGNDEISLNQLQLFVSNGDLGGSGYTYTGATATNSSNAYINFTPTSGSNTVQQVFALNNAGLDPRYEIVTLSGSGSGSGDLKFYIDSSVLNGVSNDSYLTLFTQFGNPPGTYGSDAGFEEWRVLSGAGVTDVPEPASIVMSLTGAIPLGLWALRRRRQATA